MSSAAVKLDDSDESGNSATARLSPNLPLSSSVVEQAGKAAVLLLGMLYALGLLVTNQYLLSVGVSDFTSVRPKYILTGMWALAVLAVSGSPAFAGWILWLRSARLSENKRIIAFFVVLVAVSAAAYFGLRELLDILKVPRDPAIRSEGLLCLGTSTWLGFVLIVWGFVRMFRGKSFAIGLVLYIAFCLYAVAETLPVLSLLYSEVPEALGGGRPIRATLLFNQAGVAFWNHIGMFSSITADSISSEPVDIVFQDEHNIVIKFIGPEITERTEISKLPGNLPNLNLPKLGDIEERIIVINKSLLDGIITKQEKLVATKPNTQETAGAPSRK